MLADRPHDFVREALTTAPDERHVPAMSERFRITVFSKPRAPWRDTREEAFADAIGLDLASWDAEKREHFLAVPVDMEVKRAPRV